MGLCRKSQRDAYCLQGSAENFCEISHKMKMSVTGPFYLFAHMYSHRSICYLSTHNLLSMHLYFHLSLDWDNSLQFQTDHSPNLCICSGNLITLPFVQLTISFFENIETSKCFQGSISYKKINSYFLKHLVFK